MYLLWHLWSDPKGRILRTCKAIIVWVSSVERRICNRLLHVEQGAGIGACAAARVRFYARSTRDRRGAGGGQRGRGSENGSRDCPALLEGRTGASVPKPGGQRLL